VRQLAALPRSLRSLQLLRVTGAPADELMSALQQHTPRLSRLRLVLSCALSTEQRWLLLPPSALLPELTQFKVQ